MSNRYRDASLSPEERTEDLLAQMTLDEKLAQLQCHFFAHGDLQKDTRYGIGQVSTLEFRQALSLKEASGIQREIQETVMKNSRFGIPAVFHMEGLCGALVQDATSFPAGIGRGASFDPALEEKIGEIVSRQERALGITQILAPVLDINREPRMGREGETYGEDSTLAAAMGSAYTRGIQKQGDGECRAESVAKHYMGFHQSEGGIHGTVCSIPERLLREVYGLPFQAAIAEENLRGVMPCYCSIGGEPVSASEHLLTQILRQEMGFDGVAVADYSAVSNVHHTQKLYETEAEAGLACLSAGMDVELPDTVCFNEEMKAMFAQGKADMALLDQAVRRVLRAKFRMGLFEHPFALTGSALSEMVHHPEDELITLQSALESLVLLKNDNHVLPVGKNVRKIALIGPHADNARHFFGGYTHLSMVEAIHAVMNSLAGVDASNTERKPMLTVPGTQVQSDETEEFAQIGRQIKPDCPSLLAKLTSSLPDAEITYAYGYPIAGADESHFAEALQAAAGADLVILTLGGKHGSGSVATMGEGVDATDINLPRCQDAFIRAAANLHKPMIGIHFGGRPISSDAADECLDAILEAWNPSEMGAEALTRVLTGETAPSGRMPVTTARSAGQIPVYYNHPNGSSWHQGDSIGFQEYVDMPHRPRYYFGQGLSYTTFAYDGLRIDKEEVGPREEITVSCQVTNTGSRAGTEVVQLYLRDEQACMVRPVQELVGFARVALEPGESCQVCFTFRPDRMAFLNREMRWLVEKGMIGVRIGASSEDIRLRGAFRIRESAIIQGRERCFYAKTDIF